MAIVGLIPFVYATIKRKRRSMARAADSYAGLATGGAVARGHEHARGAYQSQSYHFVVRPSPDDELGFSYNDYGAALCPPPKAAEDLSREPFPVVRCERVLGAAPMRGRESARFDGGGYRSQSCRFAVRTSSVDELVASHEHGTSDRPQAQPEALSRKLVLPASRHDGLPSGAARGHEHARSNGSAYQSQSCRFVVQHSAAYEEYGAVSTSPKDLSGKLLLPAGGSERGVSRSMRLGSMRVFAWVSGA